MMHPAALYASPPAAASPRLRGAWLLLARLAWLAIALAATAMMVTTAATNVWLWGKTDDDACALDPATQADCLANNQAHLEFFGSYLNAGLYYGLGQCLEMLPGIVMGFFIFWRRSDEPFALLFALMLVLTSVFISDGIVQAVFASNFPAFQWLANFLWNFGSALLVMIYRFPDGRFALRPLRWVAVGWVVLMLGGYFLPATLLNISNWPGPLATITRSGFALSLAAALFYRYRRVSGPTERQQIKWFVASAALAAAYSLGLVVWPLREAGRVNLILNLTYLPVYYLAWALFPIGLGVAILRYRLWDIDLILRRTLIYSTLTGLLVLAYFGSVVVLESLSGLALGDSRTPLVSVVSTLGIAALFVPLRARVQRAIDRRFFRRRYDATRILSEASTGLRDETDLARLTAHVENVVADTLAPAHVALWLNAGPRPAVAADAAPTEIKTAGRPA